MTDDPITVLFSAEEFDIPGDGFMEVSLDGEQRCAARAHALFYCDLRQVSAGTHTVSVTLVREALHNTTHDPYEIVAATHSVEFVVRRPSLVIAYPPHGIAARPETELSMGVPSHRVKWEGLGEGVGGWEGEFAAVSVRHTVMHVTEFSPLLLHWHVTAPEGSGEGGKAWNYVGYVDRADHLVTVLLLPVHCMYEFKNIIDACIS